MWPGAVPAVGIVREARCSCENVSRCSVSIVLQNEAIPDAGGVARLHRGHSDTSHHHPASGTVGAVIALFDC